MLRCLEDLQLPADIAVPPVVSATEQAQSDIAVPVVVQSGIAENTRAETVYEAADEVQTTGQAQSDKLEPQPDLLAPPDALPEGWTALFDAAYSQYYYYNAATGQTQWQPPVLIG